MPTKRGPIRLDLQRVDVAGGEATGLPWSLADSIEADGGLWAAGDWYTDPSDIVTQAKAARAVALQLDCRDLAFLDELPDVRYLHVRTDGRPPLEPIASLRRLRALILHVGSLRGTLDLAAFPDLRWLRINLGGKGGEAMLPTMAAGHPALEWLSVTESRAKAVSEILSPFPALRTFRIHNADRIRALGPLAASASGLRNLEVDVVGLRSLDGIEGAIGLEALGVWSSPIVDVGPIRALRELRGLRLWTPRLTSIEPLRGLPRLRFLDLIVDGEPDRSVLDSLPALAAIGRRPEFDTPLPWADLRALDRADPMRREWERLRLG